MAIKISKFNIVTLVIIGALVIVILNLMSGKRNLQNMYEAANDSLVVYRNSLNQQIAKTSVIVAENKRQFLSLKTKDAEILRLQQIVKQETSFRKTVEVAILLKNQIISVLRDSLKNTIVGGQDVISGDTVYKYPTYEKIINDKWTYEKITLGLNVFERDLKIKNEYELVIGREPNGLFKSKQYAKITNLNPNCETTTMKVYQEKKFPSLFVTIIKWGGLGFLAGRLL